MNIKYSLGFFLILFFCIELNAQSLSGSWGYKIDGKQITLSGDKISNYNNGGSSGTLMVAIYATNYPYSGGSINGYKLYETQLEPLEGGYSYNDISNTGWCTYPPSGSYYLTILLLEYNYSYEIVDYISMNGSTRF
jgi:hypothetical protein